MMASASRGDGVNPLRPYYKPPTIGDQPRSGPPAPAQPNPFSHASNASGTAAKSGSGGGSGGGGGGGGGGGRYASKARDIFPDLDYNDYINDPSASTVQSVRELADELLWKYTSVLMAQPFEVAKTVLQVRAQDDLGGLATATPAAAAPVRPSPSSRPSAFDGYPESDSDDEPSYFTSNAPHTPSPTRSRRRRTSSSSPLESPPPKAPPKKVELPPHQLALRRPDSIFDVIAQLWTKESAWGVWKGSNATFLYSVLQSLLENWSRSLLSAVLNVPDLGVKDDVDRLVDIASPYPWASLCVAGLAAVATGLILSPIDLVRTRLILTPTSRAPRRTMSTLRALPSWFCPASLLAPTVLHSLVHPVLTLSTPLVLRSQFLIDRELSPTTFSVAKFCTSCVSLFVKLPLETVLRRGQAAVLADPAYAEALHGDGGGTGDSSNDMIVRPGAYHGVVGTMYSIVAEEGSHAVPSTVAQSGSTNRAGGRRGGAAAGRKAMPASEVVYRQGQGVEGLWRGWKVSWWGLVGLWTAGVAGGGGEGEF